MRQLPFEVHAAYRHIQGFVRVSEHRSIAAAVRSLRSVKAKPVNLYEAHIWCARDNRRYSVELAERMMAEGYFAQPGYN